MAVNRQPQLIAASFDQLPYPAFIFANDSTVVAVNQAGQNLLGMTSEDLTDRSCSEIFHCRSCVEHCAILGGLKQWQAAAENTVRVATNTGREHQAFVTVSHLSDEAGRVQGALAVFTRVFEPPWHQRQTIVAKSHGMCEVIDLAKRVAASEIETILLEGESGTGKELIAKLLHNESRRGNQPFIAINCAAVPETLLESELFGYEKGSFTDARNSKRGLLEVADKGTLFLDEIEELPLKLQAKLLRVLDDRSYRRLGGLEDLRSDVRIVAATNQDLSVAVTLGAFRRDLYYRVNVIQLTIPPLRERRDDILPLARFFIDIFNHKFKRNIQALPGEAGRLLLAYDWPGNVRELRNLIERSVLLAEGESISADSLPLHMRNCPTPLTMPSVCYSDPDISLKENEKLLIANAMAKADGNQSQAARLLGIGRDALRYRLMNGNRAPRRTRKRAPAWPGNKEWSRRWHASYRHPRHGSRPERRLSLLTAETKAIG